MFNGRNYPYNNQRPNPLANSPMIPNGAYMERLRSPLCSPNFMPSPRWSPHNTSPYLQSLRNNPQGSYTTNQNHQFYSPNYNCNSPHALNDSPLTPPYQNRNTPLISGPNPSMTAREDPSWQFDSSNRDPYVSYKQSNSVGNQAGRFKTHSRSYSNRQDWIGSSLSDPWEGLKPKQTPGLECLVIKPPTQRHTVLFAPSDRKRHVDYDHNLNSDVSPNKRLLAL